MEYEAHEVANIFPMMSGQERADLEDDIRKHGLLEPIVLYEGKILDGRNRYKACLATGAEPKFTEVTPDDPVAHVLSLNMHRRHLNQSQLGIIAARAQGWYRQKAKERQRDNANRLNATKNTKVVSRSPSKKAKSREEVGQQFGVSGPTVQRAAKIIKDGSPELVQAVEKGETTVNAAVAVLNKPKDQQAQAAKEKTSKSPSETRKTVKRFTKTRQKELLEHVEKALKLMNVSIATRIDIAQLRHELKVVQAKVHELTPTS